MRALVTGGAGFIGSDLVDRLLAEGHEVDVVDDLSNGSLSNLADARASGGSLRFHNLDVRSHDFVDLVAHRTPEVIFHLAAQADVARLGRPSRVRRRSERPRHDPGSRGSPGGGRAKVVFAARGGTLVRRTGRGRSARSTSTSPHRPLSPYGVSKKSAIDYMVAYRELYGLEFTALALANVYGPRQDPHGEAGVVAIFAGKPIAGRQCVIYGDGKQTRDYVFVDDVVDAFARAAQRGGGLVLNIGTGNETSVIRLYEISRRRRRDRPRAASAPAEAGRAAAQRPRPAREPRCISGGSRGRHSRTASPRSWSTSRRAGDDDRGPLRWRRRRPAARRPPAPSSIRATSPGSSNTGDDPDLHGLHISPDLDTITYTLSGGGQSRDRMGACRRDVSCHGRA